MGMTKELVGPENSNLEPYFPEVIRETTEAGQVVWFNSAPQDKKEIEVKPTSSQEYQSPEV